MSFLALPAQATTSTQEIIDTDQDGLVDELELRFGSDPAQKDTDGDSFEDGLEVQNAYSPTSTAPTRLEKSIFIKLKTQTLEKRVNGIAINAYKISSGRPGSPTPTGEFRVLNKHPRGWSRIAKLWMPYWMAFTTRGHGLHELPEWPGGKKEGANHLGKPVSGGCVRMGVGTAKEMYDWAPIGTRIIIEK